MWSFNSNLTANHRSIITRRTESFSLWFVFMFGLGYVTKATVTCIHSTDPEGRLLMLSARGQELEETHISMMTSSGQPEKKVLTLISTDLRINSAFRKSDTF